MSNLEHYFENLLLYGEDASGDPNKSALSEPERKAVEICANYVLYTLFEGREDFETWKGQRERETGMDTPEAIKKLHELYTRADLRDEWNDAEDMSPYLEAILVVEEALKKE